MPARNALAKPSYEISEVTLASNIQITNGNNRNMITPLMR